VQADHDLLLDELEDLDFGMMKDTAHPDLDEIYEIVGVEDGNGLKEAFYMTEEYKKIFHKLNNILGKRALLIGVLNID